MHLTKVEQYPGFGIRHQSDFDQIEGDNQYFSETTMINILSSIIFHYAYTLKLT